MDITFKKKNDSELLLKDIHAFYLANGCRRAQKGAHAANFIDA
jgi:hypothetical protein